VSVAYGEILYSGFQTIGRGLLVFVALMDILVYLGFLWMVRYGIIIVIEDKYIIKFGVGYG